MLVPDNSVKSLRNYFSEELQRLFSQREIKQIVNRLVTERLKISSSEIILANGMLLSESDLLFFDTALKRMKNGEPVQYVVGKSNFYGLDFKIDKRALIPRPETEELVNWVVQTIGKQESEILDVCSGSGCIALGIRSACENTTVYGIDVSQDAVNLAKENSSLLNLPVIFKTQDILRSNFWNTTKKFDGIVSNPPYVPRKDIKLMQKQVTDFEPNIALFVENENPLIFYEVITQKAKQQLNSAGCIFFEIHEEYGKEVQEILKNLGFVHIELRKDLQGKNRMIKAQKL